MSKKILILGQGRHGKDTVAEILRDKYGVSFMSSSEACSEVLKPVLDVVNGEKSSQHHFSERHKHRMLWMKLISLYNSADKAALAKHILSKTDLYVGMRSNLEYNECIGQGLFDLVIYVDASKRVDYKDPTAEIEYDNTMYLVSNNGSLYNLEEEVDLLYEMMVD